MIPMADAWYENLAAVRCRVLRGDLRGPDGVIDGRTAGAVAAPQNGRPADAMLPLTERMLGRLPGPRVAWVLAGGPCRRRVASQRLPATVGAKSIPVRLLAA